MTRHRKAQIITIGLLAAALLFAVARKSDWSIRTFLPNSSPSGPQDAIYAMLDAARDGDVKKYLAACTGQLEASLRQSIAESSEAAFRQSLKDSSVSLKGVAVMEPQSTGNGEVRLRVEYVYQDRNEVQTMFVMKVGSNWRIFRLETAERTRTFVPYGTPAQ